MIEVDLDPTTKHSDPHYKRKLREAKRACKEAAGWQSKWATLQRAPGSIAAEERPTWGT